MPGMDTGAPPRKTSPGGRTFTAHGRNHARRGRPANKALPDTRRPPSDRDHGHHAGPPTTQRSIPLEMILPSKEVSTKRGAIHWKRHADDGGAWLARRWEAGPGRSDCARRSYLPMVSRWCSVLWAGLSEAADVRGPLDKWCRHLGLRPLQLAGSAEDASRLLAGRLRDARMLNRHAPLLPLARRTTRQGHPRIADPRSKRRMKKIHCKWAFAVARSPLVSEITRVT
jgi:hypothetical protein